MEIHVDLDLAGYEDVDEDGEETGIALPYVVTIAKSGGHILAIRRNWYEDDKRRMKRMHFVHYQYMPGLGFYGFGLIHLIGGLAKSATSLLRQLVDAGTLANLPGGLKARGLRIKGDDSPIMPGEFRDVDIAGGAIKDNITFLPYKEPSNVLHQMLAEIVEEGRRFASLTDLKLADMKQDAPVGTTLALIERSMKVMTAIQARLHAAMKKEFVLLADLIRDYAPDEGYEYEEEEDAVKSRDFDGRVDVIPVSDPNASTMSQRIMQYQAALQLAQQAPQMYDLPELHRQMLDVLGIDDAQKIIPLSEDSLWLGKARWLLQSLLLWRLMFRNIWHSNIGLRLKKNWVSSCRRQMSRCLMRLKLNFQGLLQRRQNVCLTRISVRRSSRKIRRRCKILLYRCNRRNWSCRSRILNARPTQTGHG